MSFTRHLEGSLRFDELHLKEVGQGKELPVIVEGVPGDVESVHVANHGSEGGRRTHPYFQT